ncbi:MAG: hypothetical protein ACK5DD_05360 [Cyclobacteriaceae bacterium]|jgi:hypothetical protein
MDSKHIEVLLEKYWNGDTSLEEEAQLRAYFAQPDVPQALQSAATLFRYFQHEQEKKLAPSFDGRVTKHIRQRQGGKIIKMVNMVNVARIAAGVLVIVAAGYLIRQEVSKMYPEDTYTDPKVAFEETKKALMMISKSFGKAQQEAGKIKMFNEAEEKIQNPGKADKEQEASI